jgi:heme oxygenase
LRVATDGMHRRLHAAPDFAALLEGRLDRHGYRGLLRKLHGLHAPLEQRLARSRFLWRRGIDMARRRRAHLLADDLAALGDAPGEPISPPALPDDGPALLGALYVREGSTLGGRELARRLDYLLGDALDGRRFFAPAPDQAVLWHECCAAIEACDDVAAMIDGARRVFAVFEAALGERT